MVTHSAVLVLNSSLEPVALCSGRRAMVLLVKNVAVAEVNTDIRVHRNYLLPSVIRLRDYRRIPYRMQVVSRRNILLRDRYTCMYCGKRFHPSALTLDHVIPSSRGGKDTWENLVACCTGCNRKKADRTPEEAGMPLISRPRPSSIHTARWVLREMGSESPAWRKYLYHESDETFVVRQ